MLRITLIFHAARNDNLGVGALTESEIEILREISRRTGLKIAITIVDGKGPREPYVSGPDIRVQDMRVLRQPLRYFRLARQSDLVLDIGGGDSFTDIYGQKRYIRLLLMKFLTLLARRPLVLAPQTVGPFHYKTSRFFAVQSIRRCAIVSTRDAASTQCIREMGARGKITEASDVALRLPYDVPAARTGAGPVRVGLNVSGLLLSGGYTRKNMFGLNLDYRQLMYDIIQRFITHPDGCELHLIPHVISSIPGSVEDDYQACLDLAEHFPGVVVAPPFEKPSEAKSYIAGMDFFMGARMHSCIAAFSSGVPVVPMAYSRKFEGLFGSLGYDRTVDCTSETAQVIIERIFEAFEDRAALAEEVQISLERGMIKLKAYETELEKLMLRLAGR